jgi:hypothetical protein
MNSASGFRLKACESVFQADIGDVNQIFKDLAAMVHDQVISYCPHIIDHRLPGLKVFWIRNRFFQIPDINRF